MNFNILPSAISEYDPIEKFGYLCPYWPHEDVKKGLVDKKKWRDTTYSPEILNYKEGREKDLIYFVPHVLKLINKILKIEGANKATLIPVPTSNPKLSPKYWDQPSPRFRRKNRDNRNIIFCRMLVQNASHLETREIVERIKEKTEKEVWNTEQHADSMQINHTLINAESNDPYILIDDVITTGGTMDGIKSLLKDKVNENLIIQVTIGKTEHPIPDLSDPFS